MKLKFNKYQPILKMSFGIGMIIAKSG